MTSLGSEISDFDKVLQSKFALDSWIAEEENKVAEMLKRPAKLQRDAIQKELNSISVMKQSITEKYAALDELEGRQIQYSRSHDHTSRISLDTLDEHVRQFSNNQYVCTKISSTIGQYAGK